MKRLFICLFVLAWAGPLAAVDQVYKARGSELALEGYDAVAYFDKKAVVIDDDGVETTVVTEPGRAVPGLARYGARWRGAVWYFSTRENYDIFMADARSYAPQYGGYCAYAVAKGGSARGDPEQWSVVDGRLYLNINREIKEKWLRDAPAYIEQADAWWPLLRD